MPHSGGLTIIAISARPRWHCGSQPGFKRGGARLTQRRENGRDQIVELAVIVLHHRGEDLFSERLRIWSSLRRQVAQVFAGGAKYAAHRPVAIVNAVLDGLGEAHKSPHQVER
jgi:hypothetical protein